MLHYTITDFEDNTALPQIYVDLAVKFIEDTDDRYVPRLLQYMIDDEKTAEICLDLPGTVEEIAAKRNISKEEVHEAFMRAAHLGLVHYKPSTGKAAFADLIVSIADYGLGNPKALRERDPRIVELIGKIRHSPEYLEERARSIAARRGGKPSYRILPRWKSIDGIPGVMPCEDIRAILKEHEGHLSTVNCICRVPANNPDCPGYDITIPNTDASQGHCIKFDEISDFFVDVAKAGRRMTAEEVLENLERTENRAMYKMTDNVRQTRGGVCTCCSDCCDMRVGLDETLGVKATFQPSRFQPRLEESDCIGCGVCIEMCPFNAVKIEDGRCSIDMEVCMGCGNCVINCAQEALYMEIVHPASWIPATAEMEYIADSFLAKD